MIAGSRGCPSGRRNPIFIVDAARSFLPTWGTRHGQEKVFLSQGITRDQVAAHRSSSFASRPHCSHSREEKSFGPQVSREEVSCAQSRRKKIRRTQGRAGARSSRR